MIKLFDGMASIGRSCIRTINPLASSLKITSVECMLTVVPSGLNANRWCTLTSISEIVLLEGEEAVKVDGSAEVEGVVVIVGGFGFWTTVSETGLTAMISWEMVSDFVVTKGKPKNCPAERKAFVRDLSKGKGHARAHQLQSYSSLSRTNPHTPHPRSILARSWPMFPLPGTNRGRDKRGTAVWAST